MDVPYHGNIGKGENEKPNMGHGFPTKASLIDLAAPMLTLNMHNPELNGIINDHQNGENGATAAVSKSNANKSTAPASESMDVCTRSPY